MALIAISDIVATTSTGTGRQQLIDVSCDGGTTTHVTVPRHLIFNESRRFRRLIEQAGFELDDNGLGKPHRGSAAIQQHVLDQVAK